MSAAPPQTAKATRAHRGNRPEGDGLAGADSEAASTRRSEVGAWLTPHLNSISRAGRRAPLVGVTLGDDLCFPVNGGPRRCETHDGAQTGHASSTYGSASLPPSLRHFIDRTPERSPPVPITQPAKPRSHEFELYRLTLAA